MIKRQFAHLPLRYNPAEVTVSPSGAHIYITNSMARGTVSAITGQ